MRSPRGRPLDAGLACRDRCAPGVVTLRDHMGTELLFGGSVQIHVAPGRKGGNRADTPSPGLKTVGCGVHPVTRNDLGGLFAGLPYHRGHVGALGVLVARRKAKNA